MGLNDQIGRSTAEKAPQRPLYRKSKIVGSNYFCNEKVSPYTMAEVDRIIIDYYRSAEFRQDLFTWVSAPRRSAKLRQHIVRQMSTNRAALGRQLDDKLLVSQDRFVSGQMSYDELLAFIERYIETMGDKRLQSAR